MKKNTVSAIFVFGVVLISLFLLTAYRPELKWVPAAGIVANHLPLIVNPADQKFSYAAYHVTADAEAADLSAARWQAMGEFYDEQGLLTRDNFDYELAADRSADRWQAMGQFYEEQGMLSRDNFGYELSADFSTARSQAMGDFYKQQVSGIVYAMDAVNMKLFNSADTSPSTVVSEGAGIVYAMDVVDLKLFNSAETSATLVAAK